MKGEEQKEETLSREGPFLFRALSGEESYHKMRLLLQGAIVSVPAFGDLGEVKVTAKTGVCKTCLFL